MHKRSLIVFVTAGMMLAGCGSSTGKAAAAASSVPSSQVPAVTAAAGEETAETADETAVAEEDSTLMELRQTLQDNGQAAAVIDLGYSAAGGPDLEDYSLASAQFAAYPFITEIEADRSVESPGGPYNAFVFVPADDGAEVSVFAESLGEEGTLVNSDQLYAGDGKPFIVKCFVADFYSDVGITIKASDGSEVVDYNPYYSGKDGSLILIDSNGTSLYDATR